MGRSRRWPNEQPSRRRKNKQPLHECCICAGFHPRVRAAHGRALANYREHCKKYPLGYYYENLLRIERNIQDFHDRCLAHDRRMASWRGRDN